MVSEMSKTAEKVERVVVVARKDWRESVNGRFLLFQFVDRNGPLKGVLWQPGSEVDNEINVNDVVRVKGDLKLYQGSYELHIASIEKLNSQDYDPSRFLPTSREEPSKLREDILVLIGAIDNKYLRSLLESIFGDEAFMKKFLRWPAARIWHHSYLGGLAEHVRDMARIAVCASQVYPEVDKDLLVAGILLHDLGKAQELEVTNKIDYGDAGRLLGHIALGLQVVEDAIRAVPDFPSELALRLKHMILSHHGELEHGSPVVPMTIEAILLHYIDNLDAQTRGALQALDREGVKPSNWTEYVKVLDRFLYRGERAEGNEKSEAQDE